MKNIIQLLAIIGVIIVSNFIVDAQVGNITTVRPASPAFQLGWDNTGTSGTLEIRNDFNQPINFFTNTFPHASLDAVGNFSIGLTNLNNCFKIGTNKILWHNGDVTSIFAGVNAGFNNSGGTIYNTLVGNGSGYSLTVAHKNTYMGYQSGYSTTTSSNNTDDNTEDPGNVAVGYQALYSNIDQVTQTAIGYKALYSYNRVASMVHYLQPATNTACGYKALYNSQAYGGCAFGYEAGRDNRQGCSLIAIGEEAARENTKGNDNIAIGEAALHHNTELSCNTAVGVEALEHLNYSPGYNCGFDSNGDSAFGCIFSYNVAVGFQSLDSTNANSHSHDTLTSGGFNTAVGSHSGRSNITGSFLSFLGYQANVCGTCTGLINSTAIGANATVKNSNQMILGDNNVNVGIGLSGTAGPTNKLEINQGTPGNSGLTFTTLTDATTPLGNTGLGVLAVNNTGKVVYVDNTGLGNYCGATPSNPLKADYEIPLNRYNYFFNGQGIGTTDVIIGTTSCSNPNPWAKLVVYQNTTQGSPASFAGAFNNSSNENLAVGVIGAAHKSLFNNIGTVGLATQSQGLTNVGVYGSVNGMAALIGGATNFGVYGFANTPSPGFVNFAVVGDLGPGVGFPSTPDFAGWFGGDIGTSAGFYAVSDSTLKDNIQNINNPISIIKSLTPKSYSFRRQQFESMQLPDGTHYGILAQDLENVLPGAVKDCIHPARHDSLGNQTYAAINFKAVNNLEIIPFLVGGMNQQQQTIDSLSADNLLMHQHLNDMQMQLDNCCHSNQRMDEDNRSIGIGKTEYSDLEKARLDQNNPNPFSSSTEIHFFLPETSKSKTILLFDMQGVLLKEYPLNASGESSITISGSELKAGMYLYTLIIDGKEIDTKRMILTN